jgi:MarR family transcriptional regulator, negative regulator of the multidrug operon emrRAB
VLTLKSCRNGYFIAIIPRKVHTKCMSDAIEPNGKEFNMIAKQPSSADRAGFIANALGTFGRATSDKVDALVEAATGLSKSFCYVIVQVGSEPNASIEMLRKRMLMDHSSMVRSLDKLQDLGLIIREKNSDKDARVVNINLTEAGEEKFSLILDSRRQYLEKITATLTPAESEILILLMSKMFQAIVDAGDDQHFVCRLCDLEVCPQEFCPVNCAYPDNFELPDKVFVRKAHSRLDH